MGPIWGQQDPGGPRVGLMHFALWDDTMANSPDQFHPDPGRLEKPVPLLDTKKDTVFCLSIRACSTDAHVTPE